MLEALVISTGAVALAEIGDKTQLLALLLAARFKRPWPIVLGILAATLLNHGLAGALGAWLTSLVAPHTLRWLLGLSFLAMAVWTLMPDSMDDDADSASRATRHGVFWATFVTFFLAEMGDKTQLATVALAAHFADVLAVVAGTTLGMLIADVPAVWLGERAAAKLPMRWIRAAAASVFAVLGLLVLANVGRWFSA